MNPFIWQQGATMRRFSALIGGLPADSAWGRYINDDDKKSGRKLASYNLDDINI